MKWYDLSWVYSYLNRFWRENAGFGWCMLNLDTLRWARGWIWLYLSSFCAEFGLIWTVLAESGHIWAAIPPKNAQIVPASSQLLRGICFTFLAWWCTVGVKALFGIKCIGVFPVVTDVLCNLSVISLPLCFWPSTCGKICRQHVRAITMWDDHIFPF